MSLIKTNSAQSCFLVVDAGYFLTREVIRALAQLGHLPIVLQFPQARVAPRSDAAPYLAFLRALMTAAKIHRPKALITINHLGFDASGVLTHLLERLHLPALVWYVDSPRYIFRHAAENVSDTVGVFVWDRTYTDWLREQGFTKIQYLPLATDPEVFVPRDHAAPPPDTTLASSLVFVGDSLTTAIQNALAKLPAEIRSAATDMLGKAAPTRYPTEGLETAKKLSSLPEFGHAASSDAQLDLESTFILAGTQSRRLAILQAMLNAHEGPVCIYGDEGWNTALSFNGHLADGRAKIRPPVDYYRLLPAVYRHAGAVLNLTSLQMPTGLNQRCYDVPAAGGFLITDNQGALAEQFEVGRETVVFNSTEELLDLWRYYRCHAAERAQVSQNGQRRVIREHTYKHRLTQMLGCLAHWFGK